MESTTIKGIASICLILVGMSEIYIIRTLSKSDLDKRIKTKINIMLVFIMVIVLFLDILTMLFVVSI